MSEDIAHLRNLLLEASPRPWFIDDDLKDANGDLVYHADFTAEGQPNPTLIVAAVNALPELLERIAELEAALQVALPALESRELFALTRAEIVVRVALGKEPAE
jgi:hypothetical protein